MSLSKHPGIPLRRIPQRTALSWDALTPVLALADMLAVFATALAVQQLYDAIAFGTRELRDTALLSATLLAGIVTAISVIQKSYRYENLLPGSRPIERAAATWCLGVLILSAALFVSKTGALHSRGALLTLFAAGLGTVVLVRLAGVRLLMFLTDGAAVSSRRIMLVGERARIAALLATEHPQTLGIAVTGSFALPEEPAERAEELERIATAARFAQPDDIVLVLPWADADAIQACAARLMELPVGIQLAPDLLLRRFPRAATARIGEMTSLTLVHRPLSRFELCLKRGLDIVLSGLGLVVAAPLLLLIALAIRIESPGPVFFRQRRYGFNRQAFRVIKFRSMYRDGGSSGFRQTTVNDERVTRVGRFLRRTNLDELPQLLNVLGGTMSLVGPRPHPVELDDSFFDRIALYARRHNVKPGMTGWAQVNGFRGETQAEVQMRARIVYDLYYLDNWSVGFDLIILFLTVFSRKSFRNAY